MASEDALLLRSMRGFSRETGDPLDEPALRAKAASGIEQVEGGESLGDIRSRYDKLRSGELRPEYRGFTVPANMDGDQTDAWFASIDASEDERERTESLSYRVPKAMSEAGRYFLGTNVNPEEERRLQEEYGLDPVKGEPQFVKDIRGSGVRQIGLDLMDDPVGTVQKAKSAADEMAQKAILEDDPESARNLADIASLKDPTGASDIASAISSARLAYREPEKRGRHLADTAISGAAGGIQVLASGVPLVGSLLSGARLKAAMRGADVADDVSDAARASRVSGAGVRRLFHASPADIDEFRPSLTGRYGSGVYMSASPDEGFARAAKGVFDEAPDSGNVLTLDVDLRNPLAYDDKIADISADQRQALIDSINKNGGEGESFLGQFGPDASLGDFYNRMLGTAGNPGARPGRGQSRSAQQVVKDAGYDGIIAPGGEEFIAFDPSAIKIVSKDRVGDAAKAVPDAPAPVFEAAAERMVEGLPDKIGVQALESTLGRKKHSKSGEVVRYTKDVKDKDTGEIIHKKGDKKLTESGEEILYPDYIYKDISASEWNDTKLDDFINAAKASGKKSVTKDELIKHLDDNKVQIEEVRLGGADSQADALKIRQTDAFNNVHDEAMSLATVLAPGKSITDQVHRFSEYPDHFVRLYIDYAKNVSRINIDVPDDMRDIILRISSLDDSFPHTPALWKPEHAARVTEARNAVNAKLADPEYQKFVDQQHIDFSVVPASGVDPDLMKQANLRLLQHRNLQEASRILNDMPEVETRLAALRKFQDSSNFQEFKQADEAYHAASSKADTMFPQWEDHTVPGGEDYQEILLTVPNKNQKILDDPDVQELKSFSEMMRVITPSELKPETAKFLKIDKYNALWDKVYAKYGVSDDVEVSDWLQSLRTEPFTGSHHSHIPNVMAHIRFKTRIDSKGRRIMFIEEIQSDWHQKGLKYGYDDDKFHIIDIDGNVVAKVDTELDAKQYIREVQDRIKSTGKPFQDGGPEDLDYKPPGTRGSYLVPNAPLKDTKEWTALAIKRIFREAADKGYDGVAFSRADMITPLVTLSPSQAARLVGNPEAFLERLAKLKKQGGMDEERAEQAETVFGGNQYYYDKLIPSIAKKESFVPPDRLPDETTKQYQSRVKAARKARPQTTQIDIEGPSGDKSLEVPFFELTDKVKDRVVKPQKLYSLALPGIAVGAAAAEEEELSAAAALGAIGMGGMALYKGMKGARAATATAKGESYFDPDKLSQLKKQVQDFGERESLIYMSPDEFLSLAKPLGKPTADKAERVAGMLGRGEKFGDIPFLDMKESGKIRGHEGRHRAMALKKLGVEKMPVRLMSDDVRWNEQVAGGDDDWYYVENLPKQLIGQDGKTKIKSPFHTEGSNRGKPLPEYSADVAKPPAADAATAGAKPPAEGPGYYNPEIFRPFEVEANKVAKISDEAVAQAGGMDALSDTAQGVRNMLSWGKTEKVFPLGEARDERIRNIFWAFDDVKSNINSKHPISDADRKYYEALKSSNIEDVAAKMKEAANVAESKLFATGSNRAKTADDFPDYDPAKRATFDPDAPRGKGWSYKPLPPRVKAYHFGKKPPSAEWSPRGPHLGTGENFPGGGPLGKGTYFMTGGRADAYRKYGGKTPTSYEVDLDTTNMLTNVVRDTPAWKRFQDVMEKHFPIPERLPDESDFDYRWRNRTKLPPKNPKDLFRTVSRQRAYELLDEAGVTGYYTWVGTKGSDGVQRGFDEIAVFDPSIIRTRQAETFFDASSAGAKTPADVEESRRLWEEKGVESPYFKRWFGESKVVDDDGEALPVFHGTSGDFDEFRAGTPESAFGSAIYLSDNVDEVNVNYARLQGSDIKNRVASEVERIIRQQPEGMSRDPWKQGKSLEGVSDEEILEAAQHSFLEKNKIEFIQKAIEEKDVSYINNAEGEFADSVRPMLIDFIARKRVLGNVEPRFSVMKTYVNIENPVYLDPSGTKGRTTFDYNVEYDEAGDIVDESGSVIDLLETIDDVAGNFDTSPANARNLKTFILEEVTASFSGEIDAFDIFKEVKDGNYYFETEMGKDGTSEFIRQVFEQMGFDGIIADAYHFFGPRDGSKGFQKLGMDDVTPGTYHYMPFKPEQIKSATGNVGTFDPSGNILKGIGVGAAVPAAAAVRSQRDPEEGNPMPDSTLEVESRFTDLDRMLKVGGFGTLPATRIAITQDEETGNPSMEDGYDQSIDIGPVVEFGGQLMEKQIKADRLYDTMVMIESEYANLSKEDAESRRGEVLTNWYSKTSDEFSVAEADLEQAEKDRYFMGSDFYYDTLPEGVENFDEYRAFSIKDLRGPKIVMDIPLRQAQESEQRDRFSATMENGPSSVDLFGRSGSMNRYIVNKSKHFNHPVQSVQLNFSEKTSLKKDIKNVEDLNEAGLISFLLYKELIGDIELL